MLDLFNSAARMRQQNHVKVSKNFGKKPKMLTIEGDLNYFEFSSDVIIYVLDIIWYRPFPL